jgi:predicted Zn-dependent protease
MTLEAFYALLTGVAGVTAIVGTGDSTRIHYGQRPQQEREPGIVLQLVVENYPGHHMEGPSGVVQGIVRLNCFGREYTEAADLADTVRAAIDGHTGVVSAGASDWKFARIIVQTSGEIPRDIPAGQAGPNVFGVYIDADFMLNPQPYVEA